jgi:hypothetical protein
LGFAKIAVCCQRALEDGFQYCWIDTCCIDKSSSAELSEAINSMFRWYKESSICYVYLGDVNENTNHVDDATRHTSTSSRFPTLEQSRWFTRGWTLQELIAPAVVEFYDAHWVEIGTKQSLREVIEKVTGIDGHILDGEDPRTCNAAVRMSWASRRETSRLEDEAYCLIGLFDVNMPLIYGEGRRAFRRLQEEIMRVEEDYTLFVWSATRFFPADTAPSQGLLAWAPSDFDQSYDLGFGSTLSGRAPSYADLTRDCFTRFEPSDSHIPPHLTSQGLRISLPLGTSTFFGNMACITLVSLQQKDSHMLCVTLQRRKRMSSGYIRPIGGRLQLLPVSKHKEFKRGVIYVDQPISTPESLRAMHMRDYGSPSLWMYKIIILKVHSDVSPLWPDVSDIIPMVSLHDFAEIQSCMDTFVGLQKYNRRAISDTQIRLAALSRLQTGSVSLKSMLMNHEPISCFFVARAPAENWLTFAIGDDKSTGLVVHFGTPEVKGRPWCSACRIKAGTATPQIWYTMLKDLPMLDRVSVSFPQAQIDTGMRIMISIRQIASYTTGTMKFPRYVLSIDVGRTKVLDTNYRPKPTKRQSV